MTTGRKFSLVEKQDKDQTTWGIELQGEFDMVESIRVLSKTIDFLAAKILTDMKSGKIVDAVESQIKQMEANK